MVRNIYKPGRCVLGVACLLGTCGNLYADSVSIAPSKDNSIFGINNNSNGSGPALFSGRTGPFASNIIQRALLEFDIAGSVPAGATITSVTLTLYLEKAGNAIDESHALHRVQAEWGEGTSSTGAGNGAPATASDATWVERIFGSFNWTTSGGDFDPISSGTQLVGAHGVQPVPITWGSTSGMVADAQAWLDDSTSNHGWILIGNELDLQTARKFSSREHPETTQRPQLLIEYDLGATCLGDLDGLDGTVNVSDLLSLLGAWGANPGHPADLNDDGTINVLDLLAMLAAWGPCP